MVGADSVSKEREVVRAAVKAVKAMAPFQADTEVEPVALADRIIQRLPRHPVEPDDPLQGGATRCA